MATKMRKITTPPPTMASLSWRSRIQAICPSERPSMALPETAAVGSGGGPPGLAATSIGTAIVKPICDSGRGIHRTHG